MADSNQEQISNHQRDGRDDEFNYGQVYQITSTPKLGNKYSGQRQNMNCIQQPQSTNHEPVFQQGIEQISDGQRSFSRQRQQCMSDRFPKEEIQQNFTCTKNDISMEQQQLSKTFTTKPPKEKKSISTKTFAHGLMDVSLLTTHATQLRTVMSNKDHEFYDALLWMICLSIGLQVLSGIFLLTSDFFKTQDKVTDRQNQKKRKVLSFLSLIIVAVNTPLKILISAFYISNEQPSQRQNLPSFSPSSFSFYNHTEL